MKATGIFLRGFLIVTLVAWNVRHVAQGHYGAAFLTGGGISLLWWLNAGLAAEARKHRASAIWYALGAACGTVAGMWLGRA